MSRAESRKKKKQKRILLIVILAILVIALAFAMIKLIGGKSQGEDPIKGEDPITGTDITVTPEKVEPQVTLNTDYGSADQATQELLSQFFSDYYKSVASLGALNTNVALSFDDTQGIQAARYKTAVDYLIEVRKMQPTDLSITSMSANLKVTKYSKTDEKIKVTVIEDTFMKFAEFDGLETEIYGIENSFAIDPTTMKITGYKKVQDFYLLFGDAEDKSELDSLKTKYLGLIQKKLDKRDNDEEAFLNGAVPEAPAVAHEYDRAAAAEYAKTYVNKRNKEYMNLDGNNCQNFASQVLRAGGICDDHVSTGEYTTWYYNSASDFTTVWTYVPYFRTYAKSNSGTGLSAKVDANWFTAEPGDIVEVGITGPTRHTTVIADVYRDKEGNYVDSLLSSNTLDMRNFPVTAYVYPYTSLVKVYGWND